MPLVRITGWQRGLRPSLPPTSLTTLFIKEIGMDGTDAEAALRRLMRGKFVDASFDVGEDRAALAFMREVDAFGLTSKLYPDKPFSARGSPPRPLFLKLSLAVLVGFGVWFWTFWRWPGTIAFTTVSIMEGALLMFWGWSGSGGILDRRPKPETQKEWEKTLGRRWALGAYGLFGLIALIVVEPVYAAVLLLVALCGIGFAFLIRMMNRN